jgi:V/A-type H+-transporting ATPase subunit A
VRLVGVDSLSPQDRIVLETTKSIREDFLHQSAFDAEDAYTRLAKQHRMLKAILDLHHSCIKGIEKRVPLRKLIDLPVRQRIARMRYVSEKDFAQFDEVAAAIETELAASMKDSRTGEE